MKEKREKHERQLIAKEKRKEELDVTITQYGGLSVAQLESLKII